MNEYIVTHATDDLDRVVLIRSVEGTAAQRTAAQQTIRAESWVHARALVNTVGIYHDEGYGWRQRF